MAGDKKWKAGLYVRLSKEDGGDESMSIANQKQLLTRHIDRLAQEDGEVYSVYDVYVDDGRSGTDYDRIAFKRLLKDIESGSVNMVAVKDLSRPFRNYADQGYFLEEFFPRYNVRFVSLGLPPLDSYRSPDMMNSISVPIQGVINDNHCRETSLKVRQVFDMKRGKGEFIGAFAPYGYMKNPKDKNKLIIDEEAANVVRDIYSWFTSGTSKNGIVHRLNELGVPCPYLYKRQKGLNYRNPHADKAKHPLWSLRTVTSILCDRRYIGDMVQGKYRIKSYKIHEQIQTPPEQWFIVEGTHEAVIERLVFQEAQQLQMKNTRTAPYKNKLYLFSGFLKCADCGGSMSRHTANQSGSISYYCSTYKNRSKSACSRHTIKHDELEGAVLMAVRMLVEKHISKPAALEIIDAEENGNKMARLKSMARGHEAELRKARRYKSFLYEDWKDGDISKDDYRSMAAEYDSRADALRNAIERLNREIEQQKSGCDDAELEYFRRQGNIRSLSRDLLASLVDTIAVYEGGGIVVRFKFTCCGLKRRDGVKDA
ncbi:MAG: recombinase family protein [Christensenellales bacterium]|jgi:site-specific DNA recombinase